jgi:hypothetical protein
MVVPEGCTLRVDAETRTGREGAFLIFDDTYEHEAFNPSDALRCMLQFDFFRPELPPERQEEVLRAMRRRIVEAVPGYAPWLHAGEVSTDADILAQIEEMAARSKQLPAIRKVVLTHGVYLAA